MLVSAVIADGPQRRVLEVLADGLAELLMPEPVPAELRRVLEDKLGPDPPAIDAILRLLDELTASTVAVPAEVDAVSGGADDDRILAAAVAGGAEVLISGDARHLLPLGEYRGMRIIRPQGFLASLAG